MKKLTGMIILLLIGLSILVPRTFAEEIQSRVDDKDLSREKKVFRNYAGEGSTSVSSFCLEGYLFVMACGDISNQSALIQVYEERNGKVVPKRCE